MVCQVDYWFMYHVQVGNRINLSALIFQDLIKVIKGSIKTILYGMHLSYNMIRAGCNVSMDPPFQRFKYTCFDKHTFGYMHCVMDIQDNYVKKPRRNPKKLEVGVHEKPERQSEQVPVTLEAPAPPLVALPNIQFVILDKLIHLRQMMMSRFDQIDQRITNLESTTYAIRVTVDALQVAQLPPPSSQTLSRIFF